MNDKDTITAIQAILSEHRPAIKEHGGDIEFVRLEGEIVYVRLHGACVGCPISFMTLTLGLERAIQAKIPHIQEVVSLEEGL